MTRRRNYHRVCRGWKRIALYEALLNVHGKCRMHYELYALTWADVFKSFELRHSFLLKKLKIDQEAIEKDISQQLGNSTGREAVNNLTALALPVSTISG